MNINSGQDEEADGERDKEQVLHGQSVSFPGTTSFVKISRRSSIALRTTTRAEPAIPRTNIVSRIRIPAVIRNRVNVSIQWIGIRGD